MICASVLMQRSRPFRDRTSVFGNVIAMTFAVVLLSELFTMPSVNFVDRGFALVPALVGETFAVAVGAGGGYVVWAYAVAAPPISRAAAPAAIKGLRKKDSWELGCLDWGRGRPSRHPRDLFTTRQNRKGFTASVAF